MEDKIEIIDEGDSIRIKGILFLKASNEEFKDNEIVGIAKEDIKKGQIGYVKI